MASDRSKAGNRPSLRLGALNLALRLAVKPRLASLEEPEAARREFTLAARFLFRAPPYALWLPGRVAGPAGDLSVMRISAGAVDRRRVILYLHGGAYVAGSPATHQAMLARLSLLSGVPVLAPDYRLAPEHPFPAALEDVAAAWRHLYDAGYDPDHIVIGGDSAGGGLAFALLSRLCRAGTAPAGVFAFSPWVDLTGRSPSLVGNARADPMLPAARLAEVAGMYLRGHSADDPDASPVSAPYPAPPPVLLQHSQTEILRDDTLRLADRVRSFGGAVTVESWPTAPHVWHLADGWVPEARDALVRTAAFVRAALRPERPPSAGS
jgi:acetyl esterase/lipase